eukprot:maker-scaffold_21-snap-gene-3.13-mRNA-1 protein AED:0.15 eAED:0.15 QI:0/0/0/0.66/0/0/6/0/152
MLINGSSLDFWQAHYGAKNFHVDGFLALPIPNSVEGNVLNPKDIKNKIGLVHRGDGVALVQKVLRLQNAGAVAALVVDNGECDLDFNCGTLGNKTRERGFGFSDHFEEWKAVNIPAVLVRKGDGQELKKFLPLAEIEIPNVGLQQIVKEINY